MHEDNVSCVLLYHYFGLPAGERSEWGSPVDGDELLRRALLSWRGHLPTKDCSE